MYRRLLPFFRVFALTFISIQAVGICHAASYVISPFQINGAPGYAYLTTAIPPMLSTRLFWDGKYAPVAGQDAVGQGNAVTGTDAAAALRTAQQADYVVWGSVMVTGTQASLDVNVMDTAGKVWQKGAQSSVDNLIGGLQQLADAINVEVFQRPAARSGTAGSRTAGPINPEFMVNEQSGSVYMNPQIRYQGMDSERIRSQRLDFESRGMEVADVNDDGKNEILLIDDYNLYAYVMEGDRLVKLAEYKLPTRLSPLVLRHIKQGGRNLIVLSCYDNDSNDALSMIFTFVNNQFHVVANRLLFYANVVTLPPLYEPAIIGQNAERLRVVQGSVFEVVPQGDGFARGGNIANLPREANVFNFVWVPGSQSSGGDYLVVVDDDDYLLTFDGNGRRVSKSDERYSGSGNGILLNRAMPGMGPMSEDEIHDYYYVPIRMLVSDLERNGTYEVLLNKPISTASSVFGNYRTFPQGEIHAMMFDGIGMDLIWKTRRIRGTVCSLALADADNDGTLDLTVNLNTYPGTLGVGKSRAMVTIYPLDLSMTDPDTAIANEF